MAQKERILSCIQPTGNPHFGNYFGAIQNWVKLQEKYECFYGIVDYHAMTVPRSAKSLYDNTLDMAKSLIACGVQSENLFIQSLIPEHTELGWIMACVTGYHELLKQTQFKSKSKQQGEKSTNDFISSGLFQYPALQAADILMYHADYVPVGEDQKQHLELTRNVARRFNRLFDTDYFKAPKTLLTDIPKVQSLADPTKKMSKSLGGKHYIGLFEDRASIAKKVGAAVTGDYDHIMGKNSVGIDNLFSILRALGKGNFVDKTLQPLYEKNGLSYRNLKEKVTNELVATNSVFINRLNEINESPQQIDEMLRVSSARIRVEAQKTLGEIREIVGLQSFKSQPSLV